MTRQDAELTATLEVELPADRVLPAELDLIEAHLSALVQQMLLQEDETDKAKE